MKDIFVDTNCAAAFANPVQESYKQLIQWLVSHGTLVVNKKLIAEYTACCGAARSATNLVAIVSHLTKSGRLNTITRAQLAEFRFPAAYARGMTCNKKDHDHVKTVILSFRKLALSGDSNFRNDVIRFPQAGASAASDPTAISYQ